MNPLGNRENINYSTMTHILPPHTDINLVVPTSIQSALQMDQQSPTTQQQQQQPTTTTTTPTNTTNTTTTTSRKRKKNDSMVDDPTSHPEPRRLRRSHEACARCRNKKIKASPVTPAETDGNSHLRCLSAILNIQGVQLAKVQV
jgi:hypothetical protein